MTSFEKETRQPNDTASVVSRIRAAARKTGIRGETRVASFSEGDDYSPIYLLFFHPSAMERLIVYLKVDPDLVNSPEEVVTDVLRAEILRVMRNGYNQ